jgi:hypothetical protein
MINELKVEFFTWWVPIFLPYSSWGMTKTKALLVLSKKSYQKTIVL